MFSKSLNNKNQRASERVELINDAYFIIDDENADYNEAIKCWCRNLSEGGLAINTEAKLPENVSALKILYRINSKYRNDKIIIKSKNKDVNYNRYGCMFAETDDERNSMISSFMQKESLKI